MIDVVVRQCTKADLKKLVAREPSKARQYFEKSRYKQQKKGACLLLLAWHGGEIVGRTTLRLRPTYANVRVEHGDDFPEINALDAWPPGQGIGSQIIAACERIAAERGATRIGIAVDDTNPDARRLYERVGYAPWGEVVDEWGEVDDRGRVVLVHQDHAVYLIKRLT